MLDRKRSRSRATAPFLALIVLGATTVASAQLTSTVASAGPDVPRGVHLSYPDDPTKAILTWHTLFPSTSRAEWGPVPGPPYPNSAEGADYSSPNGSLLHSVTLDGLLPNTTYYYRVGDATMTSWFGEASFRSAPAYASDAPFTVASAGDFGNSMDTFNTSQAISRGDPNLVLLLGDYYYSTEESVVRSVWENFQAFGSSAFVMTSMGNHEYYDPSIAHHCAFVRMPGNERTFAFTYGSAFLMTLDWGQDTASTGDGVDGSPAGCAGVTGTPAIRSWADARLAEASANRNITWKIVFQHFPCYLTNREKSSSLCPDGTGFPDQTEDIFVARGVDLVLTAHSHTYGRTHPVRFNQVIQTGANYDNPGAPIYLGMGTGGKPRTAACRTEPYVAVCRSTNLTTGYGRFTVSRSAVAFDFIENSLGVVDSFTLTKTPPDDYGVTVSPSTLAVGRNASASATVTISGYSSSPVSMSASGCPADTACSFAPTSDVPPFVSTFRVTSTSTSPYGSYPVTISATNASSSRTTQLDLQITDWITRSFQKGDGGAFSETDDAYIYDGAVNQNFGGDLKLFVDASGCIATKTICKSLIAFPGFIGPIDGQVPPGSTVRQAVLELTVTNQGGTQRLHQVTEGWDETTVAWNSFATRGSPTTKGIAASFAAPVGRISLDLTSIVQSWANGESNYGLLIDSLSSDGADYDSSESVNRPKLTVTFSPPPSPLPFDFALALDPSNGSAEVGGAVSANVTVALVSGLPEPVAFGCEGPPSGIACSFVPVACVPGCQSTLTISAEPTTRNGEYALRVVGSSPSASHEATFMIVVLEPPPFNFTLSLDPVAGSVERGGSTRTTVLAALLSGVSETVSFGCDNLPPETTCAFVPPACSPTCQSALTISTQTSTPVGTYPIRVTAHNETSSREATFDLTVTDPQPFDFVLSLEPSGAIVVRGETAEATLTASLTSGLPEPVTFECVDLALGVTCSFLPIVCDPTCQSALFLSTSDATPPGTYSLRIVGSGPNSSREAAFALVVSEPPPFDFSLSVEPALASSIAGGSVTSSANATLIAGRPEPITFACSNLPTDTTCVFVPAACDPTCESIVTVTTQPTTPDGTRTIQIIAASPSVTREATFTLTVYRFATLSFQQRDGGFYSETDDVYIDSGFPGSNFGSSAKLYVDNRDCTVRGSLCKSLIRFPDYLGPAAGQIPFGSTIEWAFLEITITNSGDTQRAFQVVEAWAELTATWNGFAVPGSPATKSFGLNFSAPKGRISVNITPFVQSWANGEPNLGLLITGTRSNGVDYDASESNAPPRLTVRYRPPSTSPPAPSLPSTIEGPEASSRFADFSAAFFVVAMVVLPSSIKRHGLEIGRGLRPNASSEATRRRSPGGPCSVP